MPYQWDSLPEDYGAYQNYGYGQPQRPQAQIFQNAQYPVQQGTATPGSQHVMPNLAPNPQHLTSTSPQQYPPGFHVHSHATFQQVPPQHQQQLYVQQDPEAYMQILQAQRHPGQPQFYQPAYQTPSPQLGSFQQMTQQLQQQFEPPPVYHHQHHQQPHRPQSHGQPTMIPQQMHVPQPIQSPQFSNVQSSLSPRLPREMSHSAMHERQFQTSSQSPVVPHGTPPNLTARRVAARVEIPVQSVSVGQVPAQASPHDVPRPAKRRRSSEGHPVSAIDPRQLQLRSPTLSSLPTTKSLPATASKAPSQPDIDTLPILLGLADDYVQAAYSLTSIGMSDKQYEEYYTLLATAMGCLQSALLNFRESDPRKEARIRVRLASLLIEETENDIEAEDILGKGIALADRNRLVDIKYAMHYLLIRRELKKSPKRAFKAIDTILKEVDALKLVNWSYAFRFQRLSLSVQSHTQGDTATVLKDLITVSALAQEHGHVAVLIIASSLESLFHLASGTSDAVDLAQRAMAAARSHQLSSEMGALPEIQVLLNCVDLGCALVKFTPDRIAQKMQQLQQLLDDGTKDSNWSKDGTFAVQLGRSANPDLDIDTCGILTRNKDDNAILIMRWVSRNEIYALGYLLSGLASIGTNRSSGTTEQFLIDGGKMMTASIESGSCSLSSLTSRSTQHNLLSLAMRSHFIFLHCCRYNWQAASGEIKSLRRDLVESGAELDEHTSTVLAFQEGICMHGLGDLDGALRMYTSPQLQFKKSYKDVAMQDIRTLAAMNRTLILRAHSTEDSGAIDSLLAEIEAYCLEHPNKSMHAAFHTIKATAGDSKTAIVKTKQHLQSAIQASKEVKNSQLLCIVMNVMTNMFFTNIVGDQAEKSVRAGRSLAKNCKDKLWLAVADGLYADNASRSGKVVEADSAAREGHEAMMNVPPLVKEQFVGDR